MSKKSAIKRIEEEIGGLNKAIATINKLDSKKIFKVMTGLSVDRASAIIAIPRVFNYKSIRFEILSSEKDIINPYYSSGKGKEHWETYLFEDIHSIEEVPREELPLYVGMEFTYIALERELKK